MTRPSADPALLLLLGRIVLPGEQLEAHRLRAFILNFEIARHRCRADVEGCASPGRRPASVLSLEAALSN